MIDSQATSKTGRLIVKEGGLPLVKTQISRAVYTCDVRRGGY